MPTRIKITDGQGMTAGVSLTIDITGFFHPCTGTWMHSETPSAIAGLTSSNFWREYTPHGYGCVQLFSANEGSTNQADRLILELKGLLSEWTPTFNSDGTGSITQEGAAGMYPGPITWKNLDGVFAAPPGDGTDPKTGALTPSLEGKTDDSASPSATPDSSTADTGGSSADV